METVIIVVSIICMILAFFQSFKTKIFLKDSKNTIETAQAFIDNDPRIITVDLYTYKTKNGMPDGPITSDKEGKYIPLLLKRDFEWKIPIHVVFEDKHVRPPFIELNGMLWMFHTVVQLDGRINIFVMFAGSPQPEKSPICADSKKLDEHSFEDLPIEDIEPIENGITDFEAQAEIENTMRVVEDDLKEEAENEEEKEV